MNNKNKRKQLIGTVSSSKMDKTIVVIVQRKVPHPIYKKYVNKTHWDTKEAFAAAVEKTGVHPDAINVNAEWDLYQSDKDGYRNHLKLEK